MAGKRPCISLFTALGKSLVAAALVEWGIKKGYRVLMTVPNKTLVQQNYDECKAFISKPEAIGIVCKKLNKMENRSQVVIAMYQSFESVRAISGAFQLVITDEAHEVSNNPESRYRRIFRSLYRLNPDTYFCGMSATVYRMGQGLLINNCLKGEAFYNSIPYDSSIDPGIPALIEQGYLARLEVANTVNSVNLAGIKMSGLEFNQSDAGVRFDAIIDDAVSELERGFKERGIESALIFVSNIANGKHVIDRWTNKDEIALISSKEPDSHNRNIINWLKNGTGNRYVVNVDMLTTGYNQTDLQAIVLLRATTSPGLLIQMIGRLIRPYGDKVGVVYDLGTNIERLGGIDSIKIPKTRTKKEEPLKKYCKIELCGAHNHISAKYCKECDALFISDDNSGNYSMKTKAQLLIEKREDSRKTHEISTIVPTLTYDRFGKRYIKLGFHSDYELVYTHNLMPEHYGEVGSEARLFLMNWLKELSYYSQLATINFNCESIYKLITEHDYLFKKINKITTIQNGKYRNLENWESEE
jgi:DNA repair protein RadD